MAHFNFVISQNAKWGHAGFYIDCHRMTVPENILLQKALYKSLFTEENGSTQKHSSSESINTNKAKTATKSVTLFDACNYIIIILHET